MSRVASGSPTSFAKTLRASATLLHCHDTSVVGMPEAVDTVMMLCVAACRHSRHIVRNDRGRSHARFAPHHVHIPNCGFRE
jgi:hypothetical protein